jgi:hypothetical protein
MSPLEVREQLARAPRRMSMPRVHAESGELAVELPRRTLRPARLIG